MKVEQEAEEVSTVVSGKVVVSAMGSAWIVSRSQPTSEKESGRKTKTRTDSASKKDGAGPKKRLSSARPGFRQISAAKRDKATKQQEKSVRKTPKSSKPAESLKRSASQQPAKKKKRSV